MWSQFFSQIRIDKNVCCTSYHFWFIDLCHTVVIELVPAAKRIWDFFSLLSGHLQLMFGSAHQLVFWILNFLAYPHRCGQIKFKSAKETESNVSMYIYGSIGVDWSAYRLRCTTSTGGTFEISNFLMASRSLLHFGQNQPLIFSPSKYMSMHSFRSLCLLCYGNSKLKLEKPS